MPAYDLYRLKAPQRQQFQWAPHTSGACTVKPRDYEPAGRLEASGLYAAWAALRSSERPLQVGDLLETESGKLYVCKYVGFEDARWVLPETKSTAEAEPAASGAGTAAGCPEHQPAGLSPGGENR